MASPSQAERVLDVLSRWCDAQPGRSVRLTRLEGCWTAELDDRRAAMGTSAMDALAQVATVAATEVAP